MECLVRFSSWGHEGHDTNPKLWILWAMPHELTVNILNGDAFILDVTSIDTVQELKWMLRKKFCDDPIEQKILKVDVLKE